MAVESIAAVMLWLLIVPAVMVAAAYVAKRTRFDAFKTERLLASRPAPVILGLVTALVTLYIQGGVNSVPVTHDERAYLLQAQLIGRGSFVERMPLDPAFFQQVHVFVDERVAPKYPPGHALALSPWARLGVPGLWPVLAVGTSGGLMFWLLRSVAGVWTAAFAWLIWTTNPIGLIWSASYFSQTTSGLLWLIACALLLYWKRSGSTFALALVGACVGFGITTRPVTWAALLLPMGAVVIRGDRPKHNARQLYWPALLFAVALLPLLLHNQAVTGTPWRTGYQKYAVAHLPFDTWGFRFDATIPANLSPDLPRLFEEFHAVHRAHTIRGLPRELLLRLGALILDFSGSWRIGLAVLLLARLWRITAIERFGLFSLACVLAVYLPYAHPPWWTLYYYEVMPVLSALAAVQTYTLLRQRSAAPEASRAMLLLIALLIPLCAADVTTAKRGHDGVAGYHNRFRALVDSLPGRAIVFVRYAADHKPRLSLVRAEADFNTARVWVAYDRGRANAVLCASALDRDTYLFEESSFTVKRFECVSHGGS